MLFSSLAHREQVHALRRRYYAHGFRPVPLRNGEKFPTHPEWPMLAREDPPDVCRCLADARFLNTGVLCDGLRALDIDIDDAAQVAEVLGWITTRFGEPPLRYRDNSPRLLALFAAAEGEPPKQSLRKHPVTGARVEVLGRGTQFFSDGLHPSGVPMRWQGDSPDTIKRSDLICLSSKQVDAFLAFSADLLGIKPPPPREPVRAARATPAGAWFIGDVAAALAEIPHRNQDREDWFEIACAVWDATAGSSAGFEAWRAWSQPCGSYSLRAAEALWASLGGRTGHKITAATLWFRVMEANPAWVKPSTSFTPLRLFNPQPGAM